MDGAAKQISTSTAEVFAGEVRPFRGRCADQLVRRGRTGGGVASRVRGRARSRRAPNRRHRIEAPSSDRSPCHLGRSGRERRTVTAVTRQPPVDCSRGGELELDRQRDDSVSLRHTGARPGPTPSTATGADSVLRRVSARQGAAGHRLGRSVVALARLLAPGPSGGAEPPRRGSDARGERARRDRLWRWIRADGDSTGMYGCPRRSPGRRGGGVRPSALPSPRGGNSLAATIRTALPGCTGDVGARMRTAAHAAGPVL